MQTADAAAGEHVAARGGADDFSLVRGGPLFRMLLKTRLAQPQLGLLRRRMLLIPALAWLPLLALTLLEGHALGGVHTPFLYDLEAYARFLVAMPLLILAEVVVHRTLGKTIPALLDRGIVPGASMDRFHDAVDRAIRMRDSLFPELILLAVVLVLGPWLWRHGLALPVDTWYARVDGSDLALTPAGMWFIHISAPMFQFLLLRWYFRIAIWWLLLWRVSRLSPVVKAAHPDRCGGLGFLGESVYGFMPVLVAQATVVSAFVASRVTSGAVGLLEFRGEIGVLIVLLVALVFVPLLFFTPGLIAERSSAMLKYDGLGAEYVRDFEDKWFSGTAPPEEPLLGNPDFSGFSDLGASMGVARTMWPLAFDMRTFVQTVLLASVPFLPLVLTVVPLAEVLQRIAGMVL